MLAEGFGAARVTKILAAVFGLDPLLVALAALGILIFGIELARSKDAARVRARAATFRSSSPS
jgi:hypothetical protein